MQHVTSIVTNICFSKYITKNQGSIVDAHFICFSTLDHFITVPGAGWLGVGVWAPRYNQWRKT